MVKGWESGNKFFFRQHYNDFGIGWVNDRFGRGMWSVVRMKVVLVGEMGGVGGAKVPRSDLYQVVIVISEQWLNGI